MDEPQDHEEMKTAAEVVVLNRDLFFGVRIGNLLRETGYAVTFTPDAAAFVERLLRNPAAALGLIDMAAGVDWRAIAGVSGGPVPLLAFGPHKDVASFRAAKEAGVTRVVSNDDFQRDPLGLIRRYANCSH
ncbi:MAG: hypothetical protein ACRDJW_12360 [Thermomicrobiales bacterium]